MAKPTGAICNLDCSYCYFLSKELLYPGSRFRMARDLQEEYVRQLIESHAHSPEVVVAWQGGEPTLMGIEFFRRTVELERTYAIPGQRVINTIQTNGTLLDDEWGSFFKANDFLVGISIDGPRPLHDRFRVDKGGRSSYDRVMRGLAALHRHAVEFNVLTTVNAANGDHGRRVYTFLRDECRARYVQFIPIVERVSEAQSTPGHSAGQPRRRRQLYRQVGTQATERSVAPAQYGRFLIDVFEEWVRHDVGSVYVQLFDTALANWAKEPGAICVHSETCGLQVALEHNGDLYSCDHFVEPAYRLGNIGELPMLEMVASERQRQFGEAKRKDLTRYCLDCEVRFACHGGCPKDRFATSPYGERGHNYLCPSYEDFFKHVDRPMRRMTDLLRRGQAPRSIMQDYARDDAQRGRNEPCTCGSGQKWKRCHGRTLLDGSDAS